MSSVKSLQIENQTCSKKEGEETKLKTPRDNLIIHIEISMVFRIIAGTSSKSNNTSDD